MTATKELGKYEVVPTTDQLMAVVEYFEKNATSIGRVNFTQKQMFENPTVSEQVKSPSYLNGINTYLTNEGFIEKVQIGGRHNNSVWDVSKLLKDYDQVLTREKVGTIRPTREEDTGELILPQDKVEIEVVRTPQKEEVVAETVEEKAPEAPKAERATHNNEVMGQLKDAIDDMMGYLQALPAEMSGHLRGISNQLVLTDETQVAKLQEDYGKLQGEYGNFQVKHENVVNELKAQKKDLEEEVQRLKTELEEVSGKANYNTHAIYRQRNLIMDEVDRMSNAPAWTIKQNKVNYRNSIETKLDTIMKEIGIEKE
jgi:hypothetical protein